MEHAGLTAIAAATAVMVVAAGAVASGQLGGSGGEEDRPLGTDTSVTEPLLDGPVASTSPTLVRAATGALPEIDMTSARRVMGDGPNTVYLARSVKDPGRICLFAAREEPGGVWSAGTCVGEDAISDGRIVVQLQDRPGGLEAPRTYYGLVPAGVRSISASWGRAAEPVGGVFTIDRPDARDGSGVLSYELDQGRVDIPLG